MENKSSTCHMTNEKRLIDANERIKWLEDNTTEEEWLVNQYNADWIYSMLEHAPTVDAVEVVHARWENIKHFGGAGCFGFCSNCKTPQKAQNATELKWLHRYCRWCGAKMDGGNEDE